VNEVALGEDRATSGDGRRIRHAAHQPFVTVIEAKPIGLLIQKRTGASSAHGVRGVVLEMSLGIELNQGDRSATNVDDVAHLGENLVHNPNLTRRHVEPPRLERLAEASCIQPAEADGIPLLEGQLAQSALQNGGWFTLVSGVEGLNDFAGTVEPHRLQRYGSNVDSYSSRLLHGRTL